MLLQNASRVLRQQVRTMKVVVDHVLADNYMYYIIDTNTREGLVVDMGDASRVADIERRDEFKVKGALITHHHWDHAGALDVFQKNYPSAKIYGRDPERIKQLTDEVTEDQVIEWNSLKIRCICTPGHTTSHTCYYVVDQKTGHKALFTGDTLFLAGCGKFFECPAEVMYKSIYDKLFSVVADNTEMYFGHEYSVNNLKFAKHVEPHNVRVLEKLETCKQQLQMNRPTTPSIWSEEKQYNPFLRVREPTVQNFAQSTDPIDVLDKLRTAKNNFKG
ncbi:Hydroxyacylglutathione hydrolase-like protein isoform X2 [Aphelenchoides fujianensis]|nr:Hydroxyacylglutathione hydrolase-like protein isoform X2 [Aphelenchoides fujianensis]